MKTVVMLLGFLLLAAMAYYGYSYGVEKSAEFNKSQNSNELPIEKRIQSIDTEVAIDEESIEEQKEEDIAVKSSLEEEIPTEVEEELLDEEDIIEDGPVADEEEEPADIEAIIDEQEELMEEAAKESEEPDNTVYSPQEMMQKIEKEEAGIPTLETEEERILREEEERNKAAIEEDSNLSE
jgi:hypothetical protein